MAAELFRYKTAIVRGIAKSLPGEALRLDDIDPVDLNKAIKQHGNYVDILRNEVGLKVIELPADDELPDCVFVEDIAVAIGDTAVITTTGHVSRRAEAALMEKTLESIGMKLVKMREEDENAFLDGGDVLFTGEEILVGLSKRTNKAGCAVLGRAFPAFPVTPIPVDGQRLHLKSCCTLAGIGKILVGVGAECKKTTDAVKERAKGKYTYIPVEGSGSGANCLYIDSPTKGKIVVAPGLEAWPESKECYEGLTDTKVIRCDASELAKVDGLLTCCSVLLTV